MRLLAVNLNYMGDALFTTPALASLRSRFPQATIDVLAGERAAAILEGNPSVDRLILRPPHGGSGRAVALARTLRAGRYDAVVLFQSTLSNALLAYTARVPIRVGFAHEGCSPLLTRVVDVRRPGEHDVDAYVRLANAVQTSSSGTVSDVGSGHLTVALSAEDTAFADHFFTRHELIPPVVGLVIGATRAQKRWPEEYFARLADKLWNASGISCVLLGGPDEKVAAEKILSLTRGAPLISAIAQTTEKQLAALIARLGVVVSGDSGPLHIATAMATPVVALFGSTDPADTGPWMPQGSSAPATILYDALSCAPCRKNPTCDGRFDCMQSLTPERVYDAVCAQVEVPARRRTLLPVAAPARFDERPTNATDRAIPSVPVSLATKLAALPVRSILVLTKHRFMGDTIVAVPLLRAARRAFPEAHITLITGSMAAQALENCPYVDVFLPNDPKTTKRTPAGSARLSASLVRRMISLLLHDRPDLCLVADRSFRAALAARLCGGRVRAGFDSEGRGWLLTHPVPYDVDRHEAECDLDILRAVAPELPGEPPYDPSPQLWPTGAECAQGAQILADHGAVRPFAIGPPLIGIQPGASLSDHKHWRAERFAEVATTLSASGAKIVLVGTEVDAAQKMVEAMGDLPVIDLTGKTKLRETMGVLTQLTLFIGNDTGVSHIAASLGTPTIALFGPTPARKWGNVGPCNRVIAGKDGDMDNISVDDVLAAARELLGAKI